jgi:hypothetical protein
MNTKQKAATGSVNTKKKKRQMPVRRSDGVVEYNQDDVTNGQDEHG